MKKRIEWLDVMKGILISFVILSHCYPAEIYRRFFTPFFLTMFFFASGYTFSLKENGRKFLCNKWRRLGAPFLILGGCRVLIQYFLYRGSLKKYAIDFLLQISCSGDEMWFVSCLISTSCVFYIILKIGDKFHAAKKDIFILGVSIILLIIGAYDIIMMKIKLFWEFEIACIMNFYMMLGWFYRRIERKIRICERTNEIILSSVIYMILIIMCKNNVDIHAEHFEHPILWFLLSLMSIGIIIYIAEDCTKRYMKNIFIFLGQNTLFYYAFAGIVRILLCEVLNWWRLTPDTYIFPIICMILAEILLYIPIKIINKICPWIVGREKKSVL
mgnify:CR=1 FL=1